jgi:hypothetical protein
VIEIAEKLADALAMIYRPPCAPPAPAEILEAMKAASLVEISIGQGQKAPAVGIMLKSVAENLAPVAMSMGYSGRAAVLETVPAVRADSHAYRFTFNLFASITVRATTEDEARDMLVDALDLCELEVDSGGNLPRRFVAAMVRPVELKDIDGKPAPAA